MTTDDSRSGSSYGTVRDHTTLMVNITPGTKAWPEMTDIITPPAVGEAES